MFYVLDDIFEFLDDVGWLIYFKLSAVFLILVLIGCIVLMPKVVSEETFVDKVVVESVDYVSGYSYTTYVGSGYSRVPITHTVPSKYNTTFNYNGETFTIDSYKIYKQCEDLINKEVTCEIKRTTYDNDKTDLKLENIVEHE